MKKVKTLKKLVKKLNNLKIAIPYDDYQHGYNSAINQSILILKKEIKSIKKSKKNIKFDIKELEEYRKKISSTLNDNFLDDRYDSDKGFFDTEVKKFNDYIKKNHKK
jgi:hypothetical protein